MDTIRFTYLGPAGSEGALAQDLRNRGFSVDYEESTEQRDLPLAVEYIPVLFSVTGPMLPGIIAGVRRITKRFKGSRVEGLPEEDNLSVEERLAYVDQLRSEAIITEEEYARERARILGKL
jgi:hypothetical protein